MFAKLAVHYSKLIEMMTKFLSMCDALLDSISVAKNLIKQTHGKNLHMCCVF